MVTSSRSFSSLSALVVLEHHLVDDRVLDHPHDQGVALQLDVHVGEQLGAGTGNFRAVSNDGGVDGVAAGDGQVEGHGRRLDPLVADHHDIAHHARLVGLDQRAGREQPGPVHRRWDRSGSA